MIIAIWGCGGSGKTTLATGLGSIYAGRGTVGIIDTNLCSPTLPIQLSGTRLEQEHSLGRHMNRLGTNEIRPYFHQHPQCGGMFLAGLTDRDTFIDYEIGFEGIDRAREFLLQSEELLGTVILDCSVQRTDPFLPVMLREADCIVLPIVPNIGAVYWYEAIRPMLQNAVALDRTMIAATMVQPFHLVSEVERQTGFHFAAQFKYSRDLARLHDECRLATEELWRESISWTKNLHLLHDALETCHDAVKACHDAASDDIRDAEQARDFEAIENKTMSSATEETIE